MTKQKPCVLLMDEDVDTLEQLQTMLQREDCHVLIAADGNAALRLAQRTPPNLIVSDLLLAGLDGYEVWYRLRSQNKAAKLPVLLVSALSVPLPDTPWRPNANANWRFLAYDAYLPKPVDLRRFARVVKKLLNPNVADSIPGGPSVIAAIENPEIRHSVTSVLRQHEFEVEACVSLAQGKKLLQAMPPAVVLVDYQPDNPAVEEIIDAARNFASNTVIILLTDPTVEIAPDILIRCHGFLSPSLPPNQLVAAINQVLYLNSMCRRTDVLSLELLSANQDLHDARQTLQAQNEELQHINTQLRELDSLKEELTGMIVHDLKTPLSAILGTLNFLATDPDVTTSTIIGNLITGAMAAGNQMVRLTETLLEGQRLEHGHLEPDTEPFHFPTVIDVSVQQVAALVRMHKLTIEMDIDDDLPLAYADPHLCQRVLENLLDNAIKFSPRDATVNITANIKDELLLITVTDQGPGIPKEDQQTIFEQFAQLKKDQDEYHYSRGGFGLGLTFCHLAIQAMGGAIWVESDGLSGTKFLFTIPTFDEEASKQAMASREHERQAVRTAAKIVTTDD